LLEQLNFSIAKSNKISSAEKAPLPRPCNHWTHGKNKLHWFWLIVGRYLNQIIKASKSIFKV
jgi:hypothetical protein